MAINKHLYLQHVKSKSLLMFTWCYYDTLVCNKTAHSGCWNWVFYSIFHLNQCCDKLQLFDCIRTYCIWGGHLKLWGVIMNSLFSPSDSKWLRRQRQHFWCISLGKKAKLSWNLKIFTSEWKHLSLCCVINHGVPEKIIISHCNKVVNHFHTRLNLFPLNL